MSPCGEIRQEFRRTKGADVDGLGDRRPPLQVENRNNGDRNGTVRPWMEQSADARNEGRQNGFCVR
jgi:hypothetical protein